MTPTVMQLSIQNTEKLWISSFSIFESIFLWSVESAETHRL